MDVGENAPTIGDGCSMDAGRAAPAPPAGGTLPVPPSPLRQRRSACVQCLWIMPPLCRNTRLFSLALVCPQACASDFL